MADPFFHAYGQVAGLSVRWIARSQMIGHTI